MYYIKHDFIISCLFFSFLLNYFELINILFSFCFYLLGNNTSESIPDHKEITVNKEVTTCIVELLPSTLNSNLP